MAACSAMKASFGAGCHGPQRAAQKSKAKVPRHGHYFFQSICFLHILRASSSSFENSHCNICQTCMCLGKKQHSLSHQPSDSGKGSRTRWWGRLLWRCVWWTSWDEGDQWPVGQAETLGFGKPCCVHVITIQRWYLQNRLYAVPICIYIYNFICICIFMFTVLHSVCIWICIYIWI